MIGRLYNKARKEREWLELCGDTTEKVRAELAKRERERLALESWIDTPGSGFFRIRCLCGHERILAGISRGDQVECFCGEAKQTVI